MAKWLDKYEQGGMVLKQKTHDNYGKKPNPNDVQASVGPNFVGLGYDTKGRNYSPAWGGQFQDGGNLWNTNKTAWVDSVNNANLNKDFVQRYYDKNHPPAPIHIAGTEKGSTSTHYMADADNMVFPTVVNPKTFNPLDVYTQPGKLQYLDKPGPVVDRRTAVDYARRTGEYINFKNEQDAQWYSNNGYKKGTDVLNSIDKGKAYNNPNYAMGGGIPGAVGFTYARVAGSAPANGKYTKKTKASAQNGKEMAFYQNGLDFTPKSISKNGSVIKDDRGQWAHPGEVTQINSNDITMQGVPYSVLGISDTGHTQMMQPGQDYKFDGKKVTEFPMMQEGGWLNKYDNISATNPLKKQAEEFLARQNNNRPTMSQYTPKAGEAERLDREKQQRIAEENAPLNRMAASKGARNMQDAALFALDVMGAAEGVGAIKSALKSKAKNVITSKVTRGPINYWEEPGFAKRNPNFNPEVYANSPIGNTSASRDIPEGMTPYIKVDDVTPNVKPSWKSQELPGLHISATMEGGPISKIIEPKTGLINVDQALTIIGKESGGASKVDMIKQVLGKDIPKKMDYNDFRKTVQDQLIPLDREVVAIDRSSYGIYNLGFNTGRRETANLRIQDMKDYILKFKDKKEFKYLQDDVAQIEKRLAEELQDINKLPLENQTIRLSNKNEFGRGSDKHGNPKETLGHIHFLRDAESPDVLTMTQLQSDAFQGTNRTMPKSLEEATTKLNDAKHDFKYYQDMFGNTPEKESYTRVLDKARENLDLEQAHVKNLTQKSLLDKNHQERYLQELVDYAGKRGDINKIRVPTSETAAKVQGYKPLSELNKSEEFIKYRTDIVNAGEKYGYNSPELKKAEEAYNNAVKNSKQGFSSEHQTILKKYSEQPKVIKKTFGVEPKTVTDSRGNSWYEFDIPAKFKGGKGEIKAFKDGGWLNKYK